MALLASRTGLKRLFNGFAAPAVAEAMPALTTSLSGFAAHAQPVEDEISTSEADNIEKKGINLRGAPLYLDMQATTPMDPRVVDAMLPFMTEQYGNPHSRTHLYGWEAEEAVEEARENIANLINADAKEIVFTSGATESNNLAIKGVAGFYKDKKKHIITTQTDHKCVLDSCRFLQQRGFDVTYLPVQSNGLVDMNQLKAAIRPDTALISVMAVNNEIGVVQPLAEIGALCRESKIFFHTDAAQAGIGALYIRRRPRVRLEAQMSGGGQERGLRSGTVPAFLAVGLGKACEVAAREMESDTAHVKKLADRLYYGITEKLQGVQLNGDESARYWGNVNLSFAYVEGESLLMGLKDVAVSSGSACTSASLEPSYVLRALGVEEDMAHTSIRFGLGRFTTEAEVDHAVELCVSHVNKLREMSPLWEMVQEGIDLKSIQWSQH
ncbi:hypothetical protein Ndes2437B_g02349 [Nannochloris sp. 'desiccata']